MDMLTFRRSALFHAGILALFLAACGGSGGGGGGGGEPEPPEDAPRLTMSFPDALVVVEPGAAVTVEILYTDGDSNDVALTDVYADVDGDLSTTGDRFEIAIGLPDGNDVQQSLLWDTSSMPAGTYRVVGRITDGKHPMLTATAPGSVRVRHLLTGLDFSPYIDGQSPDLGTIVSEAQLRARMGIVAPYTKLVRSFGVASGLESTGRIAHEMGLQAAIGAWLSADLAANRVQIDNLIADALAGNVDVAIVGSEVLLRGDLTEAELIACLDEVKLALAGTGIPITTAEVYGVLLAHQPVIDACDIVLSNYYPYWEGIHIDLAVAALHGWHQLVVAAAGGKPVIVSETGWPSAGDTKVDAVPSEPNAAAYFLNFVSWARANHVDYYYFDALDEEWKETPQNPQEAHWGVWKKDGVMKPGMQAVFDGQTVADNWSAASIPGGPGTPDLVLTTVPPVGSFADLEGRAWHVVPAEYRVAVYIKVAGGWWTKPGFVSPETTIRIDGKWTCDITTGGSDETATDVAAFLIPATYTPPAASGDGTLPAALATNAVDSVQVTR